MELFQREARRLVKWVNCLHKGARTTAHLLRPQDDQVHWDRQGHYKPIWGLFENSFLMYDKRKFWGMALQVKNRLNFKSQSSPQPYAFEQYTHSTTVSVDMALQESGKCYLHGRVKWSNVQKRNLAI